MWKTYSSCIYKTSVLPASQEDVKIAGFDLDSTLILSARGEKYAVDVNDWVFVYPEIPQQLQGLYEGGYLIAIFSNRTGSFEMHRKVQQRMNLILEQLKIPVWVFLATKDDKFRKPDTGMFKLLLHEAGVKSVSGDSFYCGDAAGEESKDRWNRWSDVDKKFAEGNNLKFLEPYQYFKKWPSPIVPLDINIIITVGQRGSGWETYEKYLNTITIMKDGRQLIVISDDIAMGREKLGVEVDLKKGIVYMILGKHPRVEDRLEIGGKLGNYVIYMYHRSSYDKSLYDKNFPKVFSILATERVIRCN